MENNKFIKKKYEYWQEDDQYFLALNDINVDLSRKDDEQYLYNEYVSKVVVFEELYELIDYLILCLQTTSEKLRAILEEISRLSKKVGE